MDIGLFLPNWLGDAAMATPALRALRRHFRDARLVAIGRPVLAELLAGGDFFDDFLVYKKRAPRGDSAASFWTLRKRLGRRLDLAILFPNSFSSAALAYLCGARRRVGYARDGRSWLLTDRVAAPRADGKWVPIPAIDYYLGLAQAVGADVHDRRMELVVTPAERNLASEFLGRVGFDDARPLIVLNDAAATSPSRVWPEANAVEFVRALLRERDGRVILHCGPSERDATNVLAARIGDPRVVSMGIAENLPVGLTKALIRQADLVVSTDSGPRHIAVALGRPTVTLFGSTDPSWTSNESGLETYAQLDLGCRPCWKKQCPLGHGDCLSKLSASVVARQAIRRLDETSRRAA